MSWRFTVLERNAVIAEDIADILAELVEEMTITLVSTLQDAQQQLSAHEGHRHIAILNATSDELGNFAQSVSIVRVLALHERIVADPMKTWVFLPPPYTMNEFGAALLMLMADTPEQ